MRQWRNTVTVPDRVHPIVRTVFVQMRHQQIGYADLAKRSGVPERTIRAWRNENAPSLMTLEAVLNALGLELRAGWPQ